MDPLTITVIIIRILNIDDIGIFITKMVKIDKINISNLNKIKIKFFRHQHILKMLIIIIIFIKLI